MRHGIAAGHRRRVAVLPTTSAGWWAIGLAVLAQALVMAWTVLPLGGLAGFVCGLAGGGVALLAIVRRRERAVTVFLALLPAVFVVVFVVAELVVPHA